MGINGYCTLIRRICAREMVMDEDDIGFIGIKATCCFDTSVVCTLHRGHGVRELTKIST